MFKAPGNGRIAFVFCKATFTDSTALDDLPKIAFDCNNCAGGKNFSCAEGHAGRLCVSCAQEPEKWSSILGKCRKCNKDWRDYLIGIGGTSGVVLTWVGLNALAAGGYDALDIALQFTQVSIFWRFACTHNCVLAETESKQTHV